MVKDIEQITPIVELLGEERVEKLKDQICEVIIDRVRADFDVWDKYICYPPDFNYLFEEAYEEIKNKLKKMYKDKLLEIATNAIDKLKND